MSVSLSHITTGYSDGSFGPNDPVTRKQMAAFLKRYFDAFGFPQG